jgi:type II secretory pathway predicted ATPase ExeA
MSFFDNEELNNHVFITGPAGTGKTTKVSEIKETLTENRIQYSVVAPTGIAAMNAGGRTIHKFLGIGISHTYESISKKNSFTYTNSFYRLQTKVKDLEYLIIDEISMVSIDLFYVLEYLLRKARNSKKLFGGVKVIMSGDFLQLPPISDEDEEELFVFQTDL